MPVDELAEHKEKLYHAQLPELQGIPEVIDLIEAQHGRIPFAVVSGSRRNSVIGSLTALGLLDKFDALVCAETDRLGLHCHGNDGLAGVLGLGQAARSTAGGL